MSLHEDASTLFTGFSKLNLEERLARLHAMGALSKDDVQQLKKQAVPPTSLAESFIENVIGYFPLPLGVAANMCIDGVNYAIPMAVEETSIIAALSKTARWIKQHGEISTRISGEVIIGQIQIAVVNDVDKLRAILEEHKSSLIASANDNVAPGFVRRGGGVEDISLRTLARPDGRTMAVIHITVNPCDAMGANVVTQICEFLKTPIEHLSGETVTMCILSNLNDQKLTTATVILRNIDPAIGKGIQEASYFAELDPYRAATHNKGILNGMDPIALATGNDWRAVEAGIHAYACKDGQYSPISTWRMKGSDLIGTLTAPIVVGTVGGVTNLHPTAKMSLAMLGVKHAHELSRIIAAVGLVQNLGALTALTTFGFIEGHMRLHIKNLCLNTDASESEIPFLQSKLEELLALSNRITLSCAWQALKELRGRTTHAANRADLCED